MGFLSNLFSDSEQNTNLLVQEPEHHDMDINMRYIINDIKGRSGLNDVKGGYWKVDNKMVQDPMGLKLSGFDMSMIKNSLSIPNKVLYLCFIAVPIDEDAMMDNLVENSNLSDWDFEERYVKPAVGTNTISVGAIFKDDVKYRTIKFLSELNI